MYNAPLKNREAFAHCERLARDHYENFPVASRILPPGLRPHVAAIYAFARTADDFADELPAPAAERLEKLADWERQLNACVEGRAHHPIFLALSETVATTGISPALLADLLTAYRMDVLQNRYERFDDLLHYCRFSANPVGRLVLQLFHEDEPESNILSDYVCTGLQLANFWQDVSVDRLKGRLYLPLDDLRRFGYTEEELNEQKTDDRFRSMMEFEVNRAEQFLREGFPLVRRVASRRLRFELSLTVRGGLGILGKIRGSRSSVLQSRPVLSGLDKTSILLSAVIGRTP